MSQTQDNVRNSFEGEAQAVIKLRAFALQAEKEGYPILAKLFRAVSEAEAVHAMRHLRNMKTVRETEENLKNAFEEETYVSGNQYPEFIQQAITDGEKAAEIAFSQARDAEERHAYLYKLALEHFAAETPVEYHVCGICGYIAENEIPDNCPLCNSKKEAFFSVA